MPDFYKVLEVSKDASSEEIKKAYRKQALKFHPDRNPGDTAAEKRFKEISEAYEVLSNEEKKRVYDQYGEAGLSGFGAGGSGAHGGGFGFTTMEEALKTFMGAFGGMGVDTIFENFFGGEVRTGDMYRARQGASKRVNLTMTFEEAVKGIEKELIIHNMVTCSSCKGKRTTSSKGVEVCSRCSGQGHVFEQRGFFSMSMSCPSCNGEGQVIKDPCKTCKGEGLVKEKQRVKVHIPAGVASGMRLRMAGYGDQGIGGGPSGDLYVFVSIQSHDIFEREEDNVIIKFPISFTEAALGCQKEIPSPHGKKCRLKIPEGTQSGAIFCIKKEGFPNVYGKGTGDLLVKIMVETPKGLTREQKELLKKLESLEKSSNFPKKTGFLQKIKSIFKNS